MRLAAFATAIVLAWSGAAHALECGASTGSEATGAPIKVGGIYGSAPPGDFSSATRSSAAYFRCVNANGGINGRPIQYLTENDQWNPELAAQSASKLLLDEQVVAMVGNSSFLEGAVNVKTYESEGIMAVPAACAVSECYASSAIAPTSQGPLPTGVGAAQYMVEDHGAEHVACINVNIPNVGQWACGAVVEYMESKGKSGSSVLINPTAPDVNSVLLEVIASGADTILVHLPAGLAIAVLKAAEEQDLRESFKWAASTPLYDFSVPAALGDYWNNTIYVNTEFAPFSDGGPDNANWKAVMDEFAEADDPRDSFSQSGYLAAKFFTEALLEMDAADLDDRAKVSAAIKGIVGKESDLLCGPYYVGDADAHMPNRSGHMVLIKDGGFEVVRDCYDYENPLFAQFEDHERRLGLR